MPHTRNRSETEVCVLTSVLTAITKHRRDAYQVNNQELVEFLDLMEEFFLYHVKIVKVPE